MALATFFIFCSQQYGYSRIEITHAFAHHDDNRVSTYAKTTFDVSLIRGFHYRRLTKDDYIQYCISIGMGIDDSSRNSVWQFEIIVSTKQYYFGSLNFGIETLAEKDVPGSKDAVDMTTSNLTTLRSRTPLFVPTHSLLATQGDPNLSPMIQISQERLLRKDPTRT